MPRRPADPIHRSASAAVLAPFALAAALLGCDRDVPWPEGADGVTLRRDLDLLSNHDRKRPAASDGNEPGDDEPGTR